MRRVLVTRPEPGASQTAHRLEDAGFFPIVLPLSEIVPLPADQSFAPGAFDAVAATSTNALRHAPRGLLSSARRCFVVGARTAAAAYGAGFGEVIEGPGDAAGLAATIAGRCGAGARILYLCGRVRLPDFEQALNAAGLSVTVAETYDTVEPAGADAARLGGQPIDAALIYSAKTAAAFGQLLAREDVAHLFKKTLLLCLSPRIAAALPAHSGGVVRIATEPTEAALLKLLGKPR